LARVFSSSSGVFPTMSLISNLNMYYKLRSTLKLQSLCACGLHSSLPFMHHLIWSSLVDSTSNPITLSFKVSPFQAQVIFHAFTSWVWVRILKIQTP